jgi:hypothetical protein
MNSLTYDIPPQKPVWALKSDTLNSELDSIAFPEFEFPFFSEKNTNMLLKEVNKRLKKTFITEDGRLEDNVVEVELLQTYMRSIYDGTMHRDIDFLNKAVVNAIVQKVKDEQEMIEINQKRDIWITQYTPDYGIARTNCIKTNKKKPTVPVFRWSNI